MRNLDPKRELIDAAKSVASAVLSVSVVVAISVFVASILLSALNRPTAASIAGVVALLIIGTRSQIFREVCVAILFVVSAVGALIALIGWPP